MGHADRVLDRWAAHPEHGAPFVARHREPARAARYGEFPDWLPPEVRSALEARGVPRLYSHQADALRAIGEGRNIVVATPTASGKTLIYNLPVLTACRQDPAARALYLFPTKALAHDQVVELDALAAACAAPVAAYAYDGDTPADARRAVRAGGRVVVTNPDMLHCGILPQHDRWQRFFAGLRYVVIDEIHAYRGVFGSHVANVLRRLRRVAAFHGSKPQFVMASATIANPAEHAEALIEDDVVAFEESGAPQGERTFFIYNPPIVDGSRGIRGSYVQAARRVAARLAREEVPTIVFANSRLSVERLTRHLREDVAADGGDPATVSGYRGGYLPEHRRGIEQGLRDGSIRTVVSTSALELGVDIGQLEACVLAGHPGSVSSALQRAGRAGRRHESAAIVLVTRSEPADQYLAAHPELFFGTTGADRATRRAPEHARLNADNLLVVADHLRCAAFELPFEAGESFGHFGVDATEDVLCWLVDQRLLHAGPRRFQWTGPPYPANGVPLRSLAEGNFVVIDRHRGHRIVGEVDFHAAATTLHPQAIYIVGGDTYQVLNLDWAGRRAEVEPVQVEYFTDAMTRGGVRILDVFEQREHPAVVLGHGEVRVFERVVGFKKIRFSTGENVGYGDVNLPDDEVHTTAFWLRALPPVLERCDLPRYLVLDALEGLGRALRSVATVHLLCDPGDLAYTLVGAEDLGPEELAGFTGADRTGELDADDDLPTLYLFERYPGGVGFHDPLFRVAPTLLRHVAELLDRCACEDGCPSCVGPPAPVAHPADRPRSRAITRQVLAALLADLQSQTTNGPG